MKSLRDRLREAGQTHGYQSASELAVTDSRELKRIVNIPNRSRDFSYKESLQESVTSELKTISGNMILRPLQAVCLHEASKAKGLLGALAVGDGKTLVALLLPTVFSSAKKPLLIVPAHLRDQMISMYAQYASHWRIRTDITLMSYHELSDARYAYLFENDKPDLIICDEVHKVRNPKATRTKRLVRYLKHNRQVIFCGLSGTITNRSLKDYAHLAEWALDSYSPTPKFYTAYPELLQWSEAIDVPTMGEARKPGALKKLCKGSENVRSGYRRRLCSIRGIVISKESKLGCTLTLQAIPAPHSKRINKYMKQLRQLWERPDNVELVSALEVAKVSKEIRIGGYHHWIWDKNTCHGDIQEWLEARKIYAYDLRTYLKRNARVGRDSPALVEKLLGDGSIQWASYDRWIKIKDEIPPPKTRLKWFTSIIVRWCAQWARDNTGIVWVKHPKVGQRIAKIAGIKYYGRGREAGKSILECKGDKSIVASTLAHGTGRNLQAFNKSLIAECPSSGSAWEQLLGRLHRQGQPMDEVTYYFFDNWIPEITVASKDAEYIENTTGARQKLIYANKIGF